MRRPALLVLLAALVASTACGLQQEAKDRLALAATDPGVVGALEPGLEGDVTTPTDPGTGLPLDPGTGQPITPSTAPSGGGVVPSAAATAKGSSVVPASQERIGVSATEIHIGVHAPLTGASPLPQRSFETGKELYWKTRRVFGRKVVMEILDDTYRPSGAIRVCQELARRSFMILGGGGTDQVQACGRDQVLRKNGVPYLSAGVTENGLRGIPTVYALSLTYPQQAPLVIRNARMQQFPMTKWAVVVSNTPNFQDAQQAIESELRKAKVEFKTFLVPKSGTSGDSAALANELVSYRAPVVFFLSQPTFFVNVVTNASQQLYWPIWTGVGVSKGLNSVTQVACPATGGRYDGRFLSPFPGLDKAPKEFFDAGGEDDIQLTLWGTSELMYKMLLGTKGNLTRSGLLASLPGSRFESETFPAIDFKGGSHFVGTAAWALKSNCSTQKYDTVGSAPLKI